MAEIYVSITGLRLNGFWWHPVFSWHAVRSFGEARAAPGNITAKARTISGIHHTITAWESRKHMLAYLTMPRPRAAMRAFPRIGTGRTIGYVSETVPEWAEAREIWENEAREVGGPRGET